LPQSSIGACPLRSPPASKSKTVSNSGPEQSLLSRILKSLDDDKAEEVVTIDLLGRSSLCDAIVVASGRSRRHVASTAEHLARRLKDAGHGRIRVEGLPQGDWVLVDAGDVIIHLFRPEVRAYYDLENMWSVDETPQPVRKKSKSTAS
jgi:ribosome-associated protein